MGPVKIMFRLRSTTVNARGFTLIELMVVIVILGILATYVGVRVERAPDEARQQTAKANIASVETALKLYKVHNGLYPSTEQGLQALVEPPTVGVIPKKYQEGGYLDSRGKVPKDPWGNDFAYLCPGVHSEFDITSYGADSAPEGEGANKDINNWELDE